MENAEKYPEKVRDILYKDIFQRPENDPVRLAYEVASEMHKGQTRKGREELDYITHPVQVYDMVRKCLGNLPYQYEDSNKKIVLTAALLHDTLEDYKGKNPGTDRKAARKEAEEKIMAAFADKDFAGNLLRLLDELTNPIKFKDEESKRQYQVAKAYSMSENAKFIKICDKTMNIISNIEEVPDDWDYKKLMQYTNTATAVVKSALRSVDVGDMPIAISTEKNSVHVERVKKIDTPEVIAIKLAGRVYSDVSDAELDILKSMRTAGKPIPSQDAPATFSMEKLVENARIGGGKIHGFSR